MIKDQNLVSRSMFEKHTVWEENQQFQESESDVAGYFHIFKEKRSHYKLVKLWFNKPYILRKSQKHGFKQLNIENGIIYQTKNSIIGEGIKLVFKETTFEFYGEVQPWFEMLKQYCIQTNFHEKYFLYRLISKGQKSNVYYAEDKTTKIDYVVKVFEKERIQSQQGIDAIQKEITILKQLQNDTKFSQLLQQYEGEKGIYLIFENCKGGDLLRYIRENNQTLNENNAKMAVKQLLESLSRLHDLNIMHRDLKPENIFLKKENDLTELIIGDFGLAEYHTSDDPLMFYQCGTPGYIAPEVLNKHGYDKQIDVYGIGIIFYMLLTGSQPFESIYPDQILGNNMKGEIFLEKIKISELGKDLLKRLLQISPNQRPSSSYSLKHRYFSQYPSEFRNLGINTEREIIRTVHSEQISPLTPQQNIQCSGTPQVNCQPHRVQGQYSVNQYRKNPYMIQLKKIQ